MELRHLRYFLTVAEELNFTRASQKLFISQPPLSRQIKELEDEVGAQLFTRSNKKVALTEAGRHFEKEIRDVLLSLQRATTQTRKIAENVSGEFRIAYISSTFSGTISELIRHLSSKYPYANFKLYEVSTTKQIDALEQGKLDLGILRAPITSSRIQTTLWFSDGYSLVYNKASLSLSSERDIEQVKDETFVFFNKDYAPTYYQTLLQICAGYGFTPDVVHESNNVSSIIQLVRNGLGVSIVPTSLSRSHFYPEIGFIELEATNLRTDVLLATPRDRASEVADEAIRFLLG